MSVSIPRLVAVELVEQVDRDKADTRVDQAESCPQTLAKRRISIAVQNGWKSLPITPLTLAAIEQTTDAGIR